MKAITHDQLTPDDFLYDVFLNRVPLEPQFFSISDTDYHIRTGGGLGLAIDWSGGIRFTVIQGNGEPVDESSDPVAHEVRRIFFNYFSQYRAAMKTYGPVRAFIEYSNSHPVEAYAIQLSFHAFQVIIERTFELAIQQSGDMH